MAAITSANIDEREATTRGSRCLWQSQFPGIWAPVTLPGDRRDNSWRDRLSQKL